MIPIDYKVIEAGSLAELCKLVLAYIVEGWEPQGGLAVDEQGYYQAMVRVVYGQ